MKHNEQHASKKKSVVMIDWYRMTDYNNSASPLKKKKKIPKIRFAFQLVSHQRTIINLYYIVCLLL